MATKDHLTLQIAKTTERVALLQAEAAKLAAAIADPATDAAADAISETKLGVINASLTDQITKLGKLTAKLSAPKA